MFYCGIVGFTGVNQVLPQLLDGLQKLEYRGYDSAGVYLNNGDQDYLEKVTGGVDNLRAALAQDGQDFAGTAGIAHTRWATHGGVSVENAHPHLSADGRFYLVHNGVIENYKELTEEYLQGVELKSETDSEVAVQLISKFVSENHLSTFDALRMMISKLDQNSAYRFLLMDRQAPDLIYVAKNKSPMLVGLSEQGNVVTSDAVGMLEVTHDFIELHDGDIAVVGKDKIDFFDKNAVQFTREPFHVDIDASEADKGTYPFYMLKEIDEQAIVIRHLLDRYLDENGVHIGGAILDEIKAADRLYIIAAGTSYHAGLAGARMFEQWAGIPTEVHISSEFAYEQPLLSAKPFFIFLTQSGETADSREVLQNINEQGYHSLTLTNVEKSTLWREATYALPLLAGPEIAVASTKAYVAQVALEAIIAYAVAGDRVDFNLHKDLSEIAVDIQAIVDDKATLEKAAADFLGDAKNAFYIGRGVDSSVSLEAALKLKEISYVQAEGFAAGELKHGTLALIEEGTPVFAIISQSKTAGLVRGNVSETTARGSKTYTIVTKSLAKADDDYILPDVNELLSPLLTVVPTQLLAYYASLQRGLNVDRPRNLAKSVTVQ